MHAVIENNATIVAVRTRIVTSFVNICGNLHLVHVKFTLGSCTHAVLESNATIMAVCCTMTIHRELCNVR